MANPFEPGQQIGEAIMQFAHAILELRNSRDALARQREREMIFDDLRRKELENTLEIQRLQLERARTLAPLEVQEQQLKLGQAQAMAPLELRRLQATTGLAEAQLAQVQAQLGGAVNALSDEEAAKVLKDLIDVRLRLRQANRIDGQTAQAALESLFIAESRSQPPSPAMRDLANRLQELVLQKQPDELAPYLQAFEAVTMRRLGLSPAAPEPAPAQSAPTPEPAPLDVRLPESGKTVRFYPSADPAEFRKKNAIGLDLLLEEFNRVKATRGPAAARAWAMPVLKYLGVTDGQSR